MAVGAGKYDDLCTEAREKAGALGAILIIIDGTHGFGFSVQAPLEALLKLPEALRGVANTIESDQKEGNYENRKGAEETKEGQASIV